MKVISSKALLTGLGPSVSSLVEHLRTPLYRNAYALILSQMGSAALGMVYWLIVARLFAPDLVGKNVGLLSAMLMLSAVAELSLTSAATRFVPRAGAATSKLVLYMYGVVVGAAVLVGLAFVLLSDWFPVVADLVDSSPAGPGWLIGAVVIWCIFRVQDGVMIGMRNATWVLAENSLFNVSKILLVAAFWAFGSGDMQFPVVLSWFLPVPFVVLLVNILIFGRLIRRHVAATSSQSGSIGLRQVVTSVAGDYVGSLVAEACIRLLPLLVLGLVGSSSSAYFNQAWVVAAPLYFIANGMASSFTVEAAMNSSQMRSYSRRALLQMARLVVPLSLVLMVAAPLVLSIFGKEYANEGTALLRWLALAALPTILNTWYLSYCRLRIDVKSIIFVQSLLSLLTLGLSYWWLPSYGITSIGVAWLISQTAVSAIAIGRTAAMLLSRSAYSERGEKSTLNQLSRRADWRFLSSMPRPRRSVCFSEGLLASSVGAVSEEMVYSDQAAGTSCDLAVAANPSDGTLRAAFDALREGGACYTEWEAWRVGGSWGINRRLRAAGFSRIQLIWPFPSPDRARVWLPVQPHSAPYRYLAAHLDLGNGAAQFVLEKPLALLLRLALRVGLVPQLCAVAYKGRPSAVDLLTLTRLEWARVHAKGTANSLSFLVSTGGVQVISKVALLVFEGKDRAPQWVLKVARLQEDAVTLRGEREILEALHQVKTADGLMLPRIVLERELNGVLVTGQTGLVGTPLQRNLRRESFPRVASELTDLQIALAKRSKGPPAFLEGREVAGEWLASLEAVSGRRLDPLLVSRTQQALSGLGSVPGVCVHNDFAPWNILRTDTGLGVFDWADAAWSGPPMLDLVYGLTTLAFTIEDTWDTPGILEIYRKLLDARTELGAAFQKQLNHYADRVGIRPDQVGLLRLLTWVLHSRFEHTNFVMEQGGQIAAADSIDSVCVPLWQVELEAAISPGPTRVAA